METLSPLKKPWPKRSDWTPFVVTENGKHAPSPRSMQSPEGIGDRVRAALFAEIQARDAFAFAAENYLDASPELRQAWADLVNVETKHVGWLTNRMKELSVPFDGRPVSDRLWNSFGACKNAREFAVFMSAAEDRGRLAGERFYAEMKTVDPITAEIFRKVALEEIEHVRLASRFFTGADVPQVPAISPVYQDGDDLSQALR